MDSSSSSGIDSRRSSLNDNCENNSDSGTMPLSTSNTNNVNDILKKTDENNAPPSEYGQDTTITGAGIGGGKDARFSVNNVNGDEHGGKKSYSFRCINFMVCKSGGGGIP